MRSKLEPGCKAIIVNGKYTGKLVKCMKFIGQPEPHNGYVFSASDMWEIDQSIIFSSGYYYYLCSAKIMQRIDDDQDDIEMLEAAILEAEKQYTTQP